MTTRPLLALCSITGLDRPLGALAEAAAAAGLGAVEVTARPPHLVPEAGPDAAREAGAAVRAAGVEVVAYGSYLGREEPVSAALAAREVALAEALGAPRIRVWGEPVGDADFAAVVAGMRTVCEAGEAAGIEVVVERHLGSFAQTAEDAERLLDAVDHPAFSLNYQPLDLLPPDAVAEQPADAARLAPRSRYLHVKNYRVNPDGGPLLFGGSVRGGVLDWRAILRAALEAGYAGPLTLEFLSVEPLPLEEKLADDALFLRELVAELGG